MSNENSVLLFEEPEAHMFPPYISKFTSDVIYFKTNQYFISTHSPFVINDFIEDARDELAIYLVGLENGETIIKKMTDEHVTDRKSTRLNSSHQIISYAVFCLKKKIKK